MKYAGCKMIDAENLAWEITEIDATQVSDYVKSHESVTMIPLELVLEIIDRQEEIE